MLIIQDELVLIIFGLQYVVYNNNHNIVEISIDYLYILRVEIEFKIYSTQTEMHVICYMTCKPGQSKVFNIQGFRIIIEKDNTIIVISHNGHITRSSCNVKLKGAV